MKKIAYLLIAAMSLVSVASCVKELSPEPMQALGNTHEFTVALPPATRTALVEGKTVWAKGDSIWVSNGSASEAIVVPEEAWGQKEFSFTAKEVYLTEDNPKLYVVYPYTASAGVKDGQIQVRIPGVQDGLFANANIAAAAAENYSITLKNVTAVMKVTIPETTKVPIYSLIVSAANGNALTGTCAVDFSGAAPVLTPASSGSNVSIQVDGLAGDFYLSVVPGTYDAGFKMTAATVDFENASETKETTVANTLSANDLVDLGEIGTNLQSLEGDGTEANPWIIENLGHMIALATTVNNGETFEGQFIKVANDISGVNMPIGTFPNADNNHPFQGDFDGANHTLTLDINGNDLPSAIRLGLFGALNSGANIHDLVLDGRVSSTGDAIGGVAGRVDAPADKDPIVIENVTNKATISGPNYIGGLVGYVTSLGDGQFTVKNCKNEGRVSASGMYAGGIVGSTFDSQRFYKIIENCSNTGSVYANANSGGILGTGYFTHLTDCINSGSVSASSPYNGIHTYSGGWKYTGYYNRGTGGIVGFVQNCDVKDCSNAGTVKGVMHVGGIAGVTYWTPVTFCNNSGSISGNPSNYSLGNLLSMSMVAGVVGYACGHASVYDCENTGDISAQGLVGGVVGFIQGASPSYNTASDRCFVKRCINKGTVTGTARGVGGVAGGICSQQFWPTVYVEDCENNGSVVSTGDGAGGVVGLAFNNNTANDVHIWNCVNKGTVEGSFWVAGILGLGHSRANVSLAQWVVTIRNCENYGTVLATRESTGGDVAAGIVGAVTCSNNPGTSNVNNSINYGDILYKEVSHQSPYCGGIAGRVRGGTIANVVNHGYVGPQGGVEKKAEGADTRLGSLVGSFEGGSLKNSYFLQGTCAQAVGTAGTQVDPGADYVLSYDTYGMLESPAIINGTEAYLVDEALNLWVGTSTAYYPWEWAGTRLAFVKE